MNNKSVTNLKKLFQLMEENPDLPVIAMVDNDVVADYGFARWFASIGRCAAEEYAVYNDKCLIDREEFKEDYYNYMDEELCEMFNYNPRINEYTVNQGKYSEQQLRINEIQEEKLEKYLDEIAEKYFKRAILVDIDLPEKME